MNSHLYFLKKIYKSALFNKLLKLNNIRVGTDCSGIEAPIIALKYLNIDFIHEFSCDNDLFVKKTILYNFSPNKYYDDILTRNNNLLPDIDIYICGFPCQSFSTGGKREGFYKKNKEGIIFFKCLEVIKLKQPLFFILENVKGLLTHEKGKTFEIILNLLNELKNYNIYYKVLRTSDYNIPQRRDRLYIIGIHKKFQQKQFKFPEPENNLKLDDILESKKYNTKRILSDSKLEIVNKKIAHYNIKKNENWTINLNASYPYATTVKDLSPCLVTTCNKVYLTKYNRFLTIRECLRLQGFPDDFELISNENESYKQIGNSMSVNILCFLFLEIFRTIL
tara:strand:- start:698 stop:1705 length:1008 start_codon:yes stop_codon:yes gene_type:complete